MPRKLFYLPLESYKERYTSQLSAPLIGWYERLWREAGVDYERIEPVTKPDLQIETGQVLDAVGRSIYSFQQVTKLLKMISEKKITSDDVIFLDDFWTPGIEAVPYLCDQIGIKPKIYAYCWAQSVDEFDFTNKMRLWMREFEKGIGNILSGIFVANTLLKQLLHKADIGNDPIKGSKVRVVGLPFDSDEVMSRMPKWYRDRMSPCEFPNDQILLHAKANLSTPRKNQVVFSSRCDIEKRPDLFVQLFHIVKARVPDVKFIITTSAKEIRSNSIATLKILRNTALANPDFIIKENQTKEEYYQTLCESKIQFNCALQDWVSFTLLEASVAGCYPIYPEFRSFGETLNWCRDYLYEHGNMDSAAQQVERVLVCHSESLWSVEQIKKRAWIHERMDDSWLRMLDIMDVDCTNSFYQKGQVNLSIPYPPYAYVSYKRVRPQ